MSEIRIPTQKRSIEKRNKIVEKGFELMCNKGYHKTNTSEIAEYAGVSTGIIYQYFNDKKEIFIEGLKNYSDSIMFPMLDIMNNIDIKFDDIENIDLVISKLIDSFINSHNVSKKAHEEIMAMSHLDDDISAIFKNKELLMTKKLVEILNNNNITVDNIDEKVHILVGIVDNLCHEIVYHKHESINYDIMKKEVIKIIINTLKKD